MSIRLDPRRLAALKLLAAEAGVRPGELVTAWVEERLDAARAGTSVAAAAAPAALAELSRRVDELARRLDALAAGAPTSEPGARPDDAEAAADVSPAEQAPARRGPGRPRKSPAASKAPRATAEADVAASRVPLHEEIAAVIAERGPLTAAELAGAIGERGRYHAPRSARPLDAATINSRVSNPAYRARFTREGGRIGLATG
jgi:hypothetical protein